MSENIRQVEDSLERMFFKPEAQLDFHPLGLLTVEEIKFYLDNFLEEQKALGHVKLLIITGNGRVVRPVVAKLLERSVKRKKLVKEFRTAGYFNGQEGAFEVVLTDK